MVAMATYIFHRLILGKVKIDIFFCLNGYIFRIYFYRNVYRFVFFLRFLLNVLVNNFSVMSGQSHGFLSITSTFGELTCLAQGHNTGTRVRIKLLTYCSGIQGPNHKATGSLEMFIEKSSMFYMVFVQITEFDWLSGRQTGLFLEKMFKKLPRNHKVDEVVTFHTCLWHYPLLKFCFSQVRTLVAMATFFTVVVTPGQ